MVNPSDHVETPARDSPPHLAGNSIFGIPRLELYKELSPVSKPVYKDKLLENIHIKPYYSNVIPGSSTFCHISQMAANAQIIKALELGFPLTQQAQGLSRAYLHNSKETNDSRSHPLIRRFPLKTLGLCMTLRILRV